MPQNLPPKFLASPFTQMVMATVLFALMGACVKLASVHAGTAWVVGMRGGVGAVIVGVIAWLSATSLHTRVPGLHLKRGLAGVTALSMWFYCMSQLPLATAVTLNYMSSVWMAVFMVLRARFARSGKHRPVDKRVLAAVAMGFIGVIVVLRPTLDRDQWLAGLIGVASGMLSAVAYMQVTALGKAGEPETRVVFYFSLTGTAMGLLMGLGAHSFDLNALASPDALGAWPGATWAALIGVGLFATLAQLLMTRAYARGPMLVMANLQYLGIVHATLLGALLFHEHLRWDAALGMALITASGIWSTRLRQG
jgi:drug/metabolite transporter (DMT)-like permease